jgi:hypothetical protein
MKDKGMTDVEVKQILDGIYIATIAGGTGAKVGIAPAQTSEERKAQAPQKLREKTFRKNDDPNKLLSPNIITNYTSLKHKLDELISPEGKHKKELDKLESPEDKANYLSKHNLVQDYNYAKDNSTSIKKTEEIISYYGKLKKSDQLEVKDEVENLMNKLVEAHKNGEEFKLDRDDDKLYDKVLEKKNAKLEQERKLKKLLK